MILPPSVAQVLEAELEGQKRADLAAAALRFSEAYRAGQPSAQVIASHVDALAYALVRMPATFAAVRFALLEARRLIPEFVPARSLDVGAGTGAATLAAKDVWPNLDRGSLVEPNAALARLAHVVLGAVGLELSHVAADARIYRPEGSADLVLAGYMLVELDPPAAMEAVRAMLASASDMVAFVEPGTSAGFARIRAARDILGSAGWHIIAPCPQAGACPLVGADWCHSYVRLPRSRTHKLLKGADAPFEDEPLSYVIATRQPRARPSGRILRPPKVDKGQVQLDLCTVTGRREATVPRRDKALYKQAKSAIAGDAWDW